jgi:hypothetical protein
VRCVEINYLGIGKKVRGGEGDDQNGRMPKKFGAAENGSNELINKAS